MESGDHNNKGFKRGRIVRTLHIQEIKVIADYIYWKWKKLQCKCWKNQGLLVALSVVMLSIVHSSTLANIYIYIYDMVLIDLQPEIF